MRETAILCVLVLGIITTFHASAAVLTATDDVAELIAGDENLLAIGLYEDAPGSSDATLIVQLLADGKILIDEGSPAKYIEPDEDIPNEDNPVGWAMPGFDDSDWAEGIYGIGYGDNDDNTLVGSPGTTWSIYTRAYFTVGAFGVRTLTLNIDYDDAVVVWLNGVLAARSMPTELPEIPLWNDQCGEPNSHEASKQDPPVYESVELEFKAVAPVSPAGALAITWGRIKIDIR